MNLADLQAKDVDELRELAGEHGVEGYEELEHSDLVLKLLDVVPLAPSRAPRRTGSRGSPPASWRSSTRASASCAATA